MPNRTRIKTERKYNKPLKDILIELYERYGDDPAPDTAVARELGITLKGLQEWRDFAKCAKQTTTRLVCIDECEVEPSAVASREKAEA